MPPDAISPLLSLLLCRCRVIFYDDAAKHAFAAHARTDIDPADASAAFASIIHAISMLMPFHFRRHISRRDTLRSPLALTRRANAFAFIISSFSLR